MKRISSTILLFFLSLLVLILGFITLWNFSLLKSETKAHTLQIELIQTESIGKPLLDQINGIRALIVNGHFSNDDPATRKTLGIEEVIPISKENNTWLVDAASDPDKNILELISKLNGPGTKIHPYSGEGENHFLAISSLGATEGTVIVANLARVYRDCEGQGIGVVNETGQLLLNCDPSLSDKLFASSQPSMKRITESKFSAGSFESDGPDSSLFSYYQPSTAIGVIGITPSKVAFRPAYFLGLRMILLLICGFGLATLLSVLLARRVTGPIELVVEATDHISKGNFDFPVEVKSKNELRTLADAVKSMAQQIKRLIISEVEKTKIEAQLEVAGTLQRTLLPPQSTRPAGFAIESLYLPADQCGGDWWSYIELGQKLVILIGDVTGHGYPSALLVAAVRGGLAQIQAQLEANSAEEFSPGYILTTLNRVVHDSARGELAMTAQCIVIDRNTGDYSMSSAAHPNAYLLQKTENVMKTLSIKGVRLGERRNITGPFQELKGNLAFNETLILYTDGLQELGTGDKLLDKKGVARFFTNETQHSPQEIVHEVQEKLIPLNEGVSLRDDITLVVVERVAHA